MQYLADISDNYDEGERKNSINGYSKEKTQSAVFNEKLFSNRRIKNISKKKVNAVVVQNIFKVGGEVLKKRN